MTMVRIDVAQGLVTAGMTTIPIQADSPDLLHLEGGTCLHAISFEARQKAIAIAESQREPVSDLIHQIRRLATLHQGDDDPHLVAVIALALAGADQESPSRTASLPMLAVQFDLKETILANLPAYRVDQLASQMAPSAERPWNQIVFPDQQQASLEALAMHLAENLIRCKGDVSENSPSPPSSHETSPAPVPSCITDQRPPVQNQLTQAASRQALASPEFATPGETVPLETALPPVAKTTFSGVRAKALLDQVPMTGLLQQTSTQESTSQQPTPSQATFEHLQLPEQQPSLEHLQLPEQQPLLPPSMSQHADVLANLSLDSWQQPSAPAIALPPPKKIQGDSVAVNHDTTPFPAKNLTDSPPFPHENGSQVLFAKEGLPHPSVPRRMSENTIGFKPQRSPQVSSNGSSLQNMAARVPPPSVEVDALAENLADLLTLEADLRGYLP